MKLLLVVLLSSSAALAQPADSSRFRFERTDSGFTRLDSQTGEVSLCQGQGADFTCRAAPDERRALSEEITRLQRENAELRQRLQEGGGGLRMPSEVEIDQALSWVDRVWQRVLIFIERNFPQ